MWLQYQCNVIYRHRYPLLYYSEIGEEHELKDKYYIAQTYE